MSTAEMASHGHGHGDHHAGNHPYHMVKPSPWPVVGATAGGTLLGGVVIYMHGGHIWLMAIGFVLVLATMYLWWRDVIREAAHGDHTGAVTRGLRFGMILFIASEVMFFVAFFWAFFNSSLTHREYIGAWPPPGVEAIPAWQLPFLNTLILLTSGATVTWAHHAIKHGQRMNGIYGLALTIALGVVFLFVQGFEYSHAPFSFRGGIFPSTFFMATGFHGFHVTVGVLFLSVCLYRQIRGHFKPNQHLGFEAAAWYWHFVDVVWLFLFIWVYWWGG